jgi:pimeloyl-ACP methyl ester carboxylesterase
MTQQATATSTSRHTPDTVFVLVHGSWHGAWCWQRVQPLLSDAGARSHAVTLTGVGERAHALGAHIRLQTHVHDVVATVVANEWTQVVLVGHSYGGVVVTQAAHDLQQRLPGVVQRVVYVDAHVPHSGESWASLQAPEVQAQRALEAQTVGGGVFLPAPDASVFGLTGADRDWVNRRQTPQPFGVYFDKLDVNDHALAALPKTYINCISPALPAVQRSRERVQAAVAAQTTDSATDFDKSWRYAELACGHDPMVQQPQALVALILA